MMTNRKNWGIGALAACGCLASLGGAGLADETTAYGYHYFKAYQRLDLHAGQLAVLAAPEAINAVRPSGTSVQPVTAGWVIVHDYPNSMAALDRHAANAIDGVFLSPVFVGELGGPVIPTRDVLLGVQPQAQADLETRLAALLQDAGLEATVDAGFGGPGLDVVRLRTNAATGLQTLELANRLAVLDWVRYAEPDMVCGGRSQWIPNDPLFNDQWGLNNTGQRGGTPDADVDAPEAWDVTRGDPSIITVVIDVGVQLDHPDMNLVPGFDAYDASNPGNPANPCDNHGTPVAGVVSAIADNGIGVAGLAPESTVASARVFESSLSCDGSWRTIISYTVDGLSFAESIGARITNNSNIYGFTSAAIADKYASTRADGMVHFACAGNGGTASLAYPSRLDSVNAVSAIDRFGFLTSFSSFGSGLFAAGPGLDVRTTDRTGFDGWTASDYTWAWGTSFSSPFAAGVAALILSIDPTLSAADVENLIAANATDAGTPGFDDRYGHGIVNAFAALPGRCRADLDGDGELTIFDFLAFQNAFDAGEPIADFDGDGELTIFDFLVFQNEFDAGCA